MSKNPHVTTDELKELVKVYSTSSSAAEVARLLGWKIEKVRTQATRLRKLGVPLRKFPRASGITATDIKSLKSLCEGASNERP